MEDENIDLASTVVDLIPGGGIRRSTRSKTPSAKARANMEAAFSKELERVVAEAEAIANLQGDVLRQREAHEKVGSKPTAADRRALAECTEQIDAAFQKWKKN